MEIARLGRVLGTSLVSGVLCALLSGCYSLAAVIHDPPQPPGTPQAITDGHLVGTWRDEAGGSVTFAASGAFAAKKICGDFADWAGDGPRLSVAQSKTGNGTWETMTWTPPNESVPKTEVTLRFSNSEMSAEYETGGSSRSPKLWVYMGDLDDYDLCTLTRQSSLSSPAG
ncbi:hypothetical protein GCM10014715_61700 [Streptomyces spiralis]|uniref:Lipoprotein n=1 Tax=Streptomyces spiralis TaxID=66376 RepID=A0A919DZN0_9ACTN|nr:hypothetical protein [Streptomyces spiralis]GHE97078.1 hypothetical protein GCM10014715_61700 [Streptomyces spiralis]